MKRIETTETAYYAGADEYPARFDELFINNRSELIEDIKFRLLDPVNNIGLPTTLTIDDVAQIKDCLEKMLEKLADFDLPDLSGQYWRYTYTFTGTGIELEMEHLGCVIVSQEEVEYHTEIADGSIRVFSVNCRLLSVEEYAKLKHVENVTVRQWIRRGKISSAFKQGSEWLIPELAYVAQGNYQEKMFILPPELQNLPEQFSYLKGISTVKIKKNPGVDTYKIRLTPRSSDSGTFRIEDEISAGEREKLELYLISESSIKPVDGMISILGKRLPGISPNVLSGTEDR